MLNKFWSLFLKTLWPALWPIIRETVVEITQDLFTRLRELISERFTKATSDQEKQAEQRAVDAEEKSREASSDNERIQAEAEAKAWREVAQQLKADNATLRQELEEAVRLSQVYARKRIDSEAERDKAQERIMSLKPPSEAERLPTTENQDKP
jgi:hypothetical protein